MVKGGSRINRKWIIYIFILFFLTFLIVGGSFLYNNSTASGIAVVKVLEVVDSENEMSVTVQFMTGEVEALEIHPVAINLIDPEQVYTITHTQKLFDQYKVIESIEETDTSWELVE